MDATNSQHGICKEIQVIDRLNILILYRDAAEKVLEKYKVPLKVQNIIRILQMPPPDKDMAGFINVAFVADIQGNYYMEWKFLTHFSDKDVEPEKQSPELKWCTFEELEKLPGMPQEDVELVKKFQADCDLFPLEIITTEYEKLENIQKDQK